MHMIRHGCGSESRGFRRRDRARLWTPFAGVVGALTSVLLPVAAQASMFKGETLDKVADVLAIVVMVLVPLVGIAAFLFVHVLPEKIAEKRHHPQAAAIKTLCFLSLVFGGLLWPIAWLWAYSKPVLYKMAYGTDKVDPHAAEGHETATEAPVAAAVAWAPPVIAAAASAPTAAPVVANTATETATSAQLLGLRDELLAMQLLAMQQRIERLAANLGGAKPDGKGTV